MAAEQKSIKPKLASDIYAVGMIGIYALTGVEPKNIPLEQNTEAVQWRHLIKVDENLAQVLDHMVCPDFRQRYSSASEALKIVRTLKLSSKSKLFGLKTILGIGAVLVAMLGGGYYYWQLENSSNSTPESSYYQQN
jgi:serine/threonine protein kinase